MLIGIFYKYVWIYLRVKLVERIGEFFFLNLIGKFVF